MDRSGSSNKDSQPIIRTIAPHEWIAYREIRLRALKESPDAFGSTYEREALYTDDAWQQRLADTANRSLDFPLFAEVDGILVGLAWGRVSREVPERANLYQMWVDPEYRGRGIGRMLVDAVITWAREKDLDALELDVTISNAPAVRLYRRAGFVVFGEPEPLRPGSKLLEQAMRLALKDVNPAP
jgi:ribosomal protein S18 acetylase RimI-like enzyme